MIFNGENCIKAAYGVYDAVRPGGRHKGLDISTPTQQDATIHAAAAGVVEFAGAVPRQAGKTWEWGWHVRIICTQNGQNYRHVYAHCAEDSLLVKQGQSVTKGQALARMGQSGNALYDQQGPHVHYQVDTWRNNMWEAVNPCAWAEIPNKAGVYNERMREIEHTITLLQSFGSKNMQGFTRANNGAEYLNADKIPNGHYPVLCSGITGEAGQSAGWQWVCIPVRGIKTYTPLLEDRNKLVQLAAEQALPLLVPPAAAQNQAQLRAQVLDIGAAAQSLQAKIDTLHSTLT